MEPPAPAAAPAAPEAPRLVECWFDYSSPYAYLGTARIERVAADASASVLFRPFLLGGLFKQIGTPVVPIAAMSEAKRRYQHVELERWARKHGVPFRFSTRFPLRTVAPLRLTLLAPAAAVPALVHALMRRTWAEDLDPSEPAVLAAACLEAGVDPALVDRLDDAKGALVRSTEEARDRGFCGAPTFVVGDQVFWGQDRLAFVAAALRGWRPDTSRLMLSSVVEPVSP